MFSDVDKALTIDRRGNVVIHRNQEAIKQAIDLNLAAMRGEYVRSTRGSDLLRFIGRPFSNSNTILLRQEVENILENLDDRIVNYFVQVEPDIDNGIYNISIELEVTFQQSPFVIRTRVRNQFN